MLTKSASSIKTPVRLLILATIIALLVGALLSTTVFASTSYNVRFTASFVSGTGGTAKVYYTVGGGSPILLGRVNSGGSADFSFPIAVNGNQSIQVYAATSDVYNEALFINGSEVVSGNVDMSGLSTELQDPSIPPTPVDKDRDGEKGE
jgi:hypothetical protein